MPEIVVVHVLLIITYYVNIYPMPVDPFLVLEWCTNVTVSVMHQQHRRKQPLRAQLGVKVCKKPLKI